ncbi:MAG: DUF3299 domain-containing protein [Aestuariibacter sp.]
MLLLLTTLAITFALPLSADSKTPTYQEIEWIALMPHEDLEALMNPPEYLTEIPDGSKLDSVKAFTDKPLEDERARRFQEALVSAQIVPTFKDEAIRIPGFIVPLQSDEQQRVTEFFIVPYFGACLHMPPPPNQIIYASHADGIELKNLYDPFWFEGTLEISLQTHDMGTAAYKLKLDRAFPFEGE